MYDGRSYWKRCRDEEWERVRGFLDAGHISLQDKKLAEEGKPMDRFLLFKILVHAIEGTKYGDFVVKKVTTNYADEMYLEIARPSGGMENVTFKLQVEEV